MSALFHPSQSVAVHANSVDRILCGDQVAPENHSRSSSKKSSNSLLGKAAEDDVMRKIHRLSSSLPYYASPDVALFAKLNSINVSMSDPTLTYPNVIITYIRSTYVYF